VEEGTSAETGLDLTADPLQPEEDVRIPSLGAAVDREVHVDEAIPGTEGSGVTEGPIELPTQDFYRWMNRSPEVAPGIGSLMNENLTRIGVENIGAFLQKDREDPDALLALPRLTEALVAGVWEYVAQDLGISLETLRRAVEELPEDGGVPKDVQYATLCTEMDVLRAKLDMLGAGTELAALERAEHVDQAFEGLEKSLESWKDFHVSLKEEHRDLSKAFYAEKAKASKLILADFAITVVLVGVLIGVLILM